MFLRRGGLDFYACLPPYGGSGLKCFFGFSLAKREKSPSIRREWIEMKVPDAITNEAIVSLHTEGVD